jgi:hypothetical protein
MKRKRNIETYLLLFLRRIGMICKKPRPHKYEIRIQSTCYPDEQVTSIEAEQHVWILNKMSGRKNCKFDTKTRVCECGVKGIDEFAIHCNK